MSQQNPQPLPELPPMKSAGASKSQPSPIQPSVAHPVGGGGGMRRMRQIVGSVASGGFVLVIGIVGLQLVAKPGLRPTDIMAEIEAQTDIGVMNQKLGQQRGEVAFTEAEYREKLAEAERNGQAKVELAFQEKLAFVQADKERVVGAYQTLYQRANMIAQMAVQMELVAMQFRQRLLEMTNGGRSVIISIYDGLCAFGNEDACQSARAARSGMIEEADELTQRNVASKVRELMADIPDPASLLVSDDQRRNGTPHIER